MRAMNSIDVTLGRSATASRWHSVRRTDGALSGEHRIRYHPFSRALSAHVGDAATVYLMARMVDYPQPFYDEACRWIRDQLPKAHLLSARGLWPDTPSWLAGWRTLCNGIDIGAIVTESHIGRGVAVEMIDLARRQVPLLWLRVEDERLRPVARFRAEPLSTADWSRYGYLTRTPPAGQPFAPLLDGFRGLLERRP